MQRSQLPWLTVDTWKSRMNQCLGKNGGKRVLASFETKPSRFACNRSQKRSWCVCALVHRCTAAPMHRGTFSWSEEKLRGRAVILVATTRGPPLPRWYPLCQPTRHVHQALYLRDKLLEQPSSRCFSDVAHFVYGIRKGTDRSCWVFPVDFNATTAVHCFV